MNFCFEISSSKPANRLFMKCVSVRALNERALNKKQKGDQYSDMVRVGTESIAVAVVIIVFCRSSVALRAFA